MPARTAHDLRCICSRRTKLAEWGVTEGGAAYLHVKTFKQGRLFGEIVVTDGVVDMCCRDCLRWTKVKVRRALVEWDNDVKIPAVMSA